MIISKTINIPKSFYNQVTEAYSADSLLNLLSHLTNDSVVEVIGITRKEIYVTKEYKFRENNKDVMPTFPKKVFGFGYVSGNACVISDFKLVCPDNALLNNRLRKVTLHEIGHNLGLQHCNDDNCIMSESNGNIGSLNKTGGDYCERCKQKLK